MERVPISAGVLTICLNSAGTWAWTRSVTCPVTWWASSGGSNPTSAGTSCSPCGRISTRRYRAGAVTTGTSWPPVPCGTPTTRRTTRSGRRRPVFSNTRVSPIITNSCLGDIYYKMMAVCDFIVLPSIDETQSGTLARIIATNRPYITSAPMEGLTAQTLESEGGLLFTTKGMLREKTVRLACDQELRSMLKGNLERYLDEVVSWEVVAPQYSEAYDLARTATETGNKVELDPEF